MDNKIIDDDSEKLKYIDENIIDKGYNVDDLNAFIIGRRAVSIEDLPLNLLKIEIEDFKNEKLKDAFITVKKTMALTKRDEQLNELYSCQIFKIKYLPMQECILSQFEKDKKKLNIKITNGKFEKIGGIFSQNKFVCEVSCKELESNVNRTFDDFEWLKYQLSEKYPLIYIPPLCTINIKDKSKNDISTLFIKNIIRFLKAIMRRKLLRISPMIYQFLTLDKDKFIKYKEALNKRKFTLHLKMENFKSLKEIEEFNFNKQQIYLPEKYIQKINFTSCNNLTTSLNETLTQISNDFKNLSLHIKDLSNIFSNLYSLYTQAEFNDDMKNIIAKYRNIFSHWSNQYEKYFEFFSNDFKDYFTYVNAEINELNNIYIQFVKYKEDYEKSGIQLFEKKEKLFYEKKYDKWELSKEDKEKLNEFKNNFSEAMHYICKDYSTLIEGQKIRVACSCNIIMREFKKVNKYLGEQFLELYTNFTELCQNASKDMFDYEKLFKL